MGLDEIQAVSRPRAQAHPSLGLALCTLLLALGTTHASADTSTVSSRYRRDSLGINDDRTDLTWLSNETRVGLLQFGLHAARSTSDELSGLAPGARWTSMGGGMGWIGRWSRPYRPRAWFSGDAWNHFGIVLTVRYATTFARSIQ